MDNKIQSLRAREVQATIDDLNQYLEGNVTAEGLVDTLQDMIKFLNQFIFENKTDNFDLKKYISEGILDRFKNKELPVTAEDANITSRELERVISSEERDLRDPAGFLQDAEEEVIDWVRWFISDFSRRNGFKISNGEDPSKAYDEATELYTKNQDIITIRTIGNLVGKYFVK